VKRANFWYKGYYREQVIVNWRTPDQPMETRPPGGGMLVDWSLWCCYLLNILRFIYGFCHSQSSQHFISSIYLLMGWILHQPKAAANKLLKPTANFQQSNKH